MNEVDSARLEAYGRMKTALAEMSEAARDAEGHPFGICAAIQRNFGYRLVELWLLDPTGRLLELKAAAGPGIHSPGQTSAPIPLDAKVSLIAESCRQNHFLLVNDVLEDTRFLPAQPDGRATRAELVIPISQGGRLRGAVNIESDQTGAFSAADTLAMEAMAAQTALALGNQELFEAERRRRLEAEGLRAAGAALVTSLDLDEVLAAILEGLCLVIENDSASIMLKENGRVRFVSTRGLDTGQIAVEYPPLEELPWVRRVLAERRAFIVPDVREDPDWYAAPGNAAIRCWMGIPLVYKGEAIGLMTIDSSRPGFYGGRHALLAASFADQAAAAIENSRLYELEETRRREAETLRQVAAAVSESLDLDRTLDKVLEGLERVLEYDSANVMLRRENGSIEIVAARFPGGRYSFDPAGDFSGLPLIMRAMAASSPVLVEDRLLEPGWESDVIEGADFIRCWMGISLRYHGEAIGVLNIDHHVPGFYRAHDLELASGFALHASLAIQNAQLYDRARREIEERKQAEALAREVNAEKLEFLSGLVAVVAHEVNGPAGVAITAASHLSTVVADTKRRYAEGKLGERDFVHALDEGEETVAILRSNLDRIADLVRNFRKVAADQQLEGSRRFKVKEYLDMVLLSLKPRLRNLPHTLGLSCPADLEAETTPSALYQVVMNLVGNSLAHAFPEGRGGHMSIEVSAAGADLSIVYRDDGIGIPAENLPHIFKPFFTTARASGGTGLGLYIVSNLAAKLGGTVTCESGPGGGVRFELRLRDMVVQGGAG